MTEYYTVSEAAKILDVTTVTVRTYIRRGLLPATKIRGTQWQIPRVAVEFFDSIDITGAFAQKPKVRESAIESRSVKYAKGQGLEAYKLTGRSDPDRLFILPIWERSAKVFFVEFKAPGKKPKLHQAREHDRLKARGFRVYVVDNYAGFKDTVQKVLNEV